MTIFNGDALIERTLRSRFREKAGSREKKTRKDFFELMEVDL